MELVASSCNEKGVPKGSPRFSYPNLTFNDQNSLKWAHDTLHYISQYKYNITILYWMETSQLNICLKADAIICHSEQVDDYLSQLILDLA